MQLIRASFTAASLTAKNICESGITSDSNASINVFPDPGEGGNTGAFDSNSQPVGRDFDFI